MLFLVVLHFLSEARIVSDFSLRTYQKTYQKNIRTWEKVFICSLFPNFTFNEMDPANLDDTKIIILQRERNLSKSISLQYYFV